MLCACLMLVLFLQVSDLQYDLMELRDAHAKLRTTNDKLRRERDRWARDREEVKQMVGQAVVSNRVSPSIHGLYFPSL